MACYPSGSPVVEALELGSSVWGPNGACPKGYTEIWVITSSRRPRVYPFPRPGCVDQIIFTKHSPSLVVHDRRNNHT